MTIKAHIEGSGHRLDLSEKEKTVRLLTKSIAISKSGCWEWIGTVNKGGYGLVHYKGSSRLAHRVSLETFKNISPREGLDVCHSCDNRRCVNPAHLFVGTRQDNVNDAVSKGRQARGSQLPQTKLSRNDVLSIADRFSSGVPKVEIAEEFGISVSTVYSIAQGRNWSWVTKINKESKHV